MANGYDRMDIAATGKMIKDRMDKENISIQEMASALGVSFQAVHGYVHGNRIPTVPHFYMISRILGTTLDELIVMKKTYRRNIK